MKLIRELVEEVESLVENTSTGKNYYIEGPFLVAEAQNRNGRIYPFGVMENAVNLYKKDYITANRAVGELGHPATPSINLDRVSHVIKNLDFSESKHGVVHGKAHIIDTPMGKIAKNLIDANVKLGVSSRGLGSLKSEGGKNLVQNDFRLNTVDIVHDPSGLMSSGEGCYVDPVMENAEWILKNGEWMEVIVDMHKKRIDEKVLLKKFNSLMQQLKG